MLNKLTIKKYVFHVCNLRRKELITVIVAMFVYLYIIIILKIFKNVLIGTFIEDDIY